MSWTTVTPLSKLLAMVCFVLFPFIGFFLGIQYDKLLTKPSAPIIQKTKPSSSCIAQATCSDEGKLCPDGTYVFRQKPTCEFALCSPTISNTPVISEDELKKIPTKDEQIAIQVSQKSGIDRKDLIINMGKNDPQFASGSFSQHTSDALIWWIAVKKGDIWFVPAIGPGSPKCSAITAYSFPTSMVPICKDEKGNITKR